MTRAKTKHMMMLAESTRYLERGLLWIKGRAWWIDVISSSRAKIARLLRLVVHGCYYLRMMPMFPCAIETAFYWATRRRPTAIRGTCSVVEAPIQLPQIESGWVFVSPGTGHILMSRHRWICTRTGWTGPFAPRKVLADYQHLSSGLSISTCCR